MRCVLVNGAGFVVDVSPQPADVTACTFVLAVPAEISASPFLLTLEEGGLIGGAICLLWAGAFALRVLRRALDV